MANTDAVALSWGVGRTSGQGQAPVPMLCSLSSYLSLAILLDKTRIAIVRDYR